MGCPGPRPSPRRRGFHAERVERWLHQAQRESRCMTPLAAPGCSSRAAVTLFQRAQNAHPSVGSLPAGFLGLL